MRKLIAVLFAVLLCQRAYALNPAIRLEDLNHTSWTEKDGVPSDITSMAQTRDGWLWLGTRDGLYRFDGVSFERYPLKFSHIASLHAQDNGDLLIGFDLEGLQVLHPDGKLTQLADPTAQKLGTLGSVAMDREGTIWAVGPYGLFRYAQGKWEVISSGLQWATPHLSLLVDQYGRVWASNKDTLFLSTPGSGKVERLPNQHAPGSLIQSPDGRIWLANQEGAYLVDAPSVGQQLPRQPDFNQSESRGRGQFDRDGNLWAINCPYGLCRITRATAMPSPVLQLAQDGSEKLDQNWQLSSLATNGILEDREGNIWVATKSGLDRFRENKLTPVHIPGPAGMFSTAVDTEGQLWAADWTQHALWKIAPDGQAQRDPGRVINVIANDRDGALLLAGLRDIERIYKGKSTRIPLPYPGDKPVDVLVGGVLDDGKVLWMASLQTGLWGWVDGQWYRPNKFGMPQRIYMSALGGPGQLWLSHNNGSLSFYDNGKVTRHYDISMVGQESGIFPGPQLVVGGERGIAFLHDDKFERLGTRDDDALRNVTGMTVTPDGDRWLNGARGAVHIRRADWEASIRQPSLPLTYEVIDALEGYPGRAAMDNRLPTVFNPGNGQLWFRATGGLVHLDTTALRPNTVKPVVQLLRMNTDTRSYPASGALQLPPNTRSFNIQYTAPGLRKPEGMRYQYMLEGVDTRWQDAGTRRAAYYTNIGPGHYKFSVRALNEDGMASDTVASTEIDVAPTATQTWWFSVLCVLAAALLLYGVYKYRLKIATASIARQLQVRMDERERIARTLHDTFLQSVQALTLRVYAVLTRLPEGSEPRAKLEAILDDADRAISEGRDQVQQLRSGQDIEHILSQAGQTLAATHEGVTFDLRTSGTRRALTPPVQDEFCAIGLEAMRNAFQHAQAGKVSVVIDYGGDGLLLRVSDNGRGLDEDEARRRTGDGHWGLIGMRERAGRVGATIDIGGMSGKGTVVELRVGAALAYDQRREAA